MSCCCNISRDETEENRTSIHCPLFTGPKPLFSDQSYPPTTQKTFVLNFKRLLSLLPTSQQLVNELSSMDDIFSSK